ncbi:hypothetical protein [Lentzea sp. NBRC 102530]|uniref:hypothetical protein n=1 Tax=Lentzea sp. NBRC 102530 TaxID=3032201 RepID=UPI0024A3F3F0|nr:hypothetical protein [Lentzea sp. NBRC 102530]GLY52801.1 hypothetical protein Lesp01_64570 [Lentzea sp. NBRC 102530]
MIRLAPVLLLALAACSTGPSAPEFRTVDPCTVLADGDAGSLDGTPARSGQTCDFTFDSLTAKLTLVEAAFADESGGLLKDGGYGSAIAGGPGESNNRPLTTRCKDSSGVVTCDAVLEVRERQLVRFQVVQRSTDRNAVGHVVQGLAVRAFERLPK